MCHKILSTLYFLQNYPLAVSGRRVQVSQRRIILYTNTGSRAHDARLVSHEMKMHSLRHLFSRYLVRTNRDVLTLLDML
jgi:hypothetical protein